MIEARQLTDPIGIDRPGLGASEASDSFRRESRTSNGEFRALFESAPDAILVEDLRGNVLDVNPAGCRLHGLRREELIGRNFADLVPPEERSEALERFADLASGKVDQIDGSSYTSDGRSIPVSMRVSRFSYLGRPALLFHVSDITGQCELENRLRQSQRMEAIGRLAGGIAHDFNNLLTAILSYAQLGIKALAPDHEVQTDLIQIQRAGEHAADLTRQLLAFSRQQVLQPKVQGLNKLVADTESLLRRTIGEDVKIVTELDPLLESVKVDGGQIEQVLLNLAVNARDAMPAGGELFIETRNVVLDDEYAADHVPIEPGAYVALTVTDTGCGMSDEVRGQIFEPFFTTKAPDEGTGLGLSTVYGIVKQTGGYIWVNSDLGIGTVIDIFLPPVEVELEENRAETSIDAAAGPDQTILLTEDNQMVRQLSEQVLEGLGYRVLAAKDAEEALRIHASHAGEIDLLLTDLVLPGKDGLTLTRMILAENPAMKALLMTGYSSKARFNPDSLLEGTSFLQKPFTPIGLQRAVNRALQETELPED